MYSTLYEEHVWVGSTYCIQARKPRSLVLSWSPNADKSACTQNLLPALWTILGREAKLWIGFTSLLASLR